MNTPCEVWRVVAAAVLWLSAATTLPGQSGPDVARAYREANEAAIIRDFVELLTYPNRARDTADIEPGLLAATPSGLAAAMGSSVPPDDCVCRVHPLAASSCDRSSANPQAGNTRISPQAPRR